MMSRLGQSLRARRGIAAAVALSGMLLVGASPAHAAFLEFFGEDLNPAGTVPAGGNAETARTQFLSNLVGVGNEDFESFAVGTSAPLNLSFPGSAGAITATLNAPSGQIISGGAGRFPTSGERLWNVNPPGGSGDIFRIDFSAPIAAFGFYGTDIGDFAGQVTLELTNGTTTNVTINNTVGAPDGALLFYGFIDTTEQYTAIIFGNTSGDDGFGFDDMVIGDRQQVSVPGPATIALLGLGLLGVGYRRRLRH